MRAAVAYGFGGNAGVGAVQAGFEIAEWKCESDAFGLWAVERNRDLLPGGWKAQASNPAEWKSTRAGLVIGTPPCAAFSSVNVGARSTTRGIDSSWNSCMHALVWYAATCRGEDGMRGAEVVAFESVPGAYKNGLPLMRKLWSKLCRLTNSTYDLTHVLVTSAAIGSAQERKRYWWVASRIGDLTLKAPSGEITTTSDRLRDLEDGPFEGDHAPHQCDRIRCGCRPELYELMQPGELTKKALTRYVEAHGTPLAGFEAMWKRYQRGTWIGWPIRLHPDRPSPTLTGQCLTEVVHYSQRRHITKREGLRLMGMPDEWTLGDVPVSKAAAVIGKAAPVESCRWIANGATALLKGEVLELRGEPMDTGERLIRVGLPISSGRSPVEG